jgi:hypothetical protein
MHFVFFICLEFFGHENAHGCRKKPWAKFPGCLNKESAVLEVLFPSFKVRKKIHIAFRLAPVRLLRPQ